jgi:hypothetical protein
MLAGLVLFGAVSWFTHRSPDWQPAEIDVQSLRLVARLLWAAAISATIVLFFRARHVTTAARASTIAIIGWTLGETLALFGAVVYFLSGYAGWFLAGVAFLVLAFAVFPGKPATR